MANDLTLPGAAGLAIFDRLAQERFQPPPRLIALAELHEEGCPLTLDQLQAGAELAQQHVATLGPLLCRATPERMIGWLGKLADGLVNSPRGDRLQAINEALIEDCGDLPAAVWVPETRRAYRRANKFWPSSHELYAHLRPYALAIEREANRALRIIEAAERAKHPPEPDWVPASAEVRAHVSATWKARLAEVEKLRGEQATEESLATATAEDIYGMADRAPIGSRERAYLMRAAADRQKVEESSDAGPGNWQGAASRAVRSADAARRKAA